MSDPKKPTEAEVFYSYPENKLRKWDKGKYIEDKFLFLDGSPVKDSFFSKKGSDISDLPQLYSRLKPNGTIDETSKIGNPENYLVVNKDFNIADDKNFIARVNNKWILSKIITMIMAFRHVGNEDLQRGASHGVPAGETNAAVKDAASWNFGYITEQTNISNISVKIVAGAENMLGFITHPIRHKVPSLRYGMNLADEENMNAGIEAAKRAIGFHKSLLAVGAARSITVAPIFKLDRRASSKGGGLQNSEQESFHAAITRIGKDSVASRMRRETKGIVEAVAVSARGGVAYELARARAGAREIDNAMTAFCLAAAKISPILATRGHSGNSPGTIGTLGPFHMPAALLAARKQSEAAQDAAGGTVPFHVATRFGAGCHMALPSFAPMKKTGNGHEQHAYTAHLANRPQVSEHGSPTSTSTRSAHPPMEQWEFSEMLSYELDRQARMPPTGGTGFDPLLSPAWPGVLMA